MLPLGGITMTRFERTATFIFLAFLFSWGYWITLIFMGLRVTPTSAVTHLPGLFGPALAAILTTWIFGNRSDLRDLWQRCHRLPSDWGFAMLIILAPLLTAGLYFLTRYLLGHPLPPISDFWDYPGVPAAGGTASFVLFAILLNGYGEEMGWRGYLLHTLHPHWGKIRATLFVSAIWLVWHAPLFILNQSMSDLIGPMLVGWIIGLILGAFVLSWIYLTFDNSILVVAVWHIGYNLSVATPATSGLPAAISTTGVMMAGVWIIWTWSRR